MYIHTYTYIGWGSEGQAFAGGMKYTYHGTDMYMPGCYCYHYIISINIIITIIIIIISISIMIYSIIIISSSSSRSSVVV